MRRDESSHSSDGARPWARLELAGNVDAQILESLGESLAWATDCACLVVVAGDADAACAWLAEQKSTRRTFVVLPADAAGPARRVLLAGADDVLKWTPAAPQKVADRIRRWMEIEELTRDACVEERLIGDTACFRTFVRELVEVAAFGTGGVLLLGDSGTGKEAAARIVHDLDRRTDKREFVTVDATTIVPELAGSELFGHERGAFTGATGSRDGAFDRADGGTLFIDEIGDLPAALQPQLLRVLQEQSFKPVGADYWRASKFRLITATNRRLDREIDEGRFRSDLFHRIATHVLHIPPLRERRSDIPLLIRRFLRDIFPPHQAPELDPELEEYLLGRSYSGNVRELRQLVDAIAGRYPGSGPLAIGDLPPSERERMSSSRWDDGDFELAIRRAILLGVGAHEIEEAARSAAKRLAVEQCGGNLQLASRRLGLTERALQKWRAGEEAKAKGG